MLLSALTAAVIALAVALAVALYDERARGRRALSDWLEREKALQAEIREGVNRLLAAWREDVKIPASEIASFVSPRDEAPLDAICADWLDQYTGDARATYEKLIRSKMGHGVSSLAILAQLEGNRRLLVEVGA